MINKIIETNSKFNLINKNDNIVIGLSGGADSISLLYALYLIKERYNLKLYAAHVHHCIRGKEADSDLLFCENFCKKIGVEFLYKIVNIPALARKRKESLELCGRKERYSFFQELAEKYNAKIATAHTSSDNIETLFLNLARGSSLNGASGIPPKRGKIIRPIIECSREDVENFCNEYGLEYVTDSTNLEDDYSRNKIRHHVVPILKEINPNIEEAILRFTQSISNINDTINEEARVLLKKSECKYGYLREQLINTDNVILNEAICILFRKYNIDPSGEKIKSVVDIIKKEGVLDLSKNIFAFCEKGVFNIVDKTNKKEYFYSVSKEYENKLVFRTRKTGDIFNFIDKNWSRTLNKALMDIKYPSVLRDYVTCLCSENTVIWCEAIGLSKDGLLLKEKHNLEIRTDSASIL